MPKVSIYRLAENQPKAGISSLNEYENGMRKPVLVHRVEGYNA